MSKRTLGWWIGLWILATILYVFWIRELVIQSFYDRAPFWFDTLVNKLYPRFAVEKHRFEVTFFLRHADQIIIRLGLINSFLIISIFIRAHWSTVSQRWDQLWNIHIPKSRVWIYAWIVYTCVLYFSYDWYIVLSQLYQAWAFYRPLLIFQLLHIPFPLPIWIGLLCGSLIISCIGVLFRFWSIGCSILVALLFTLLQGWIYSFEKLDHAFAPLTYVLWLMPILFYQIRHSYSQWALPLMRIIIGTIYLQAGLEKLLIGGIKWLAPDTFRNYLYLHPTTIGLWVAEYDWLCIVFPALALVFQLSFISIVFFPKLRWIVLPVGILFHSGTYILMEIGGFVNAWIWLYGLFLFNESSTKNDQIHTSLRN